MDYVERTSSGSTMKIDQDTTIGVTQFKARCLALIDDVAKGRTERVLLTKRDRVVAALVPIASEGADIWGALRGTVRVAPGADLTQPTGELWNADA